MTLRRSGILILMTLAALSAGAEVAPFARLEIAPATVYAGQPFTIQLSLYTAGQDLAPGMQLSGLPNELQLQPFQELQPISETVNGQTYQVFRSRCEAICPQPRQLHFAPMIQGNTVRTVQTFFFVQHIQTPVQIQAPPSTLTVKPIPLDRAPKGYAGLIGSFTLDATVSTNQVLPGDLVTLSFSLSGNGRFDLLPALAYQPLPGFKVYPPREDKVRSGAHARCATQVVIPKTPESLSLPSLTLVAFNPEREAFDTLTAGPFTFKPDTNRPANQPPPPILLNGAAETTETVRLRPLHPPPRQWPGDPALKNRAEALFKSGAEACEANRLTEAIDAYSKLLALGFRTPEVNVNLGAACARNGQRGKAMVFLLRAVRAAPRDALARNHLADAQDPNFRPRMPLWSRVSLAEWKFAAIAFTAAGFLLLLLGRRRSSGMAIPALLCLAAALLALAGFLWWRIGPPQAERVLAVTAQGRLAPAASAAATVRLEEGATVRFLEQSGDWSRVELGGSTAWLLSSTLEKP
jgi:hypothetical protein